MQKSTSKEDGACHTDIATMNPSMEKSISSNTSPCHMVHEINLLKYEYQTRRYRAAHEENWDRVQERSPLSSRFSLVGSKRSKRAS
jgi:hypothetical protein